MRRRKSNLGRLTRKAQAMRRVIANQTEEERASARERNRQRMAQMRAEETAERRAARLMDARLRARRSRSAASDLLRSKQNERDKQTVAERLQQGGTDQCQTQLCVQQLPVYNLPASASDSIASTVVENCLASYHVANYQLAKAVQWPMACSKKINEQCRRSNNLERIIQRVVCRALLHHLVPWMKPAVRTTSQ